MALPLVAIAASLLPDLVKLVAGDRAGGVAKEVAEVVTTVTGTADPAEARRAIEADPQLAANLRIRLAEIALAQEKVQRDAEDQKRQAELAELRAQMENTRDARGAMLSLAQSGNDLAWGAPVISIVVTVGFFGILSLMIFRAGAWTQNEALNALLNITIGTLGAAFAAVVNFWIGSSQGSREKDQTVREFQRSQNIGTLEAVRRAVRAPASAAPAPSPAQASQAAELKQDTFDKCVEVVLAAEGGYVDDPDDPGGATNFGITKATLEAWRERTVTKAEVEALSRNEAKEIYRARYWLPMRCNDLPPGVDLMVFHFGVNAGPSRSVKLLQRAAGVTEDGSVGPLTLKAIAETDCKDLVDALSRLQGEYYRSLSTFPKFGKGWLNRIADASRMAQVMLA
ncbi:glycoside hydrolase family 108 protein [Arenibaculum pallidiluteum]|uniref:glycoside hydrolase family 108 protein n=1 Tax=Arenibaculum pallidiluteum TaxID=2812559 RepID=UPI001A974B66|nr:glycosyl hydrolase 108 family protein [Arenibaculum pallidiluteum]